MVHLIDTPAFGSDDEGASDVDFLRDIAYWLAKSYDAQILLNGIIYLHPITFSMSHSIMAKFKLFRTMCGESTLPSVLLVTTMWDKVGSTEDGIRRHVELIQRSYLWGEMIAGGSQTRRYLGHKDSAIKILSYLCEKREKTVLAIQRQLTESGDLSKTDAGKECLHEASRTITACQKSLIGIEAQMEAALKDNDQQRCTHLATVRDGYFSKINAATAARECLTVSLFDLYYQKGAAETTAEVLRKSETSQQVVETLEQDIKEAQKYEERVEQEELREHDSQSKERDTTQASGMGKGLLVDEAAMMSEGPKQHPWCPASTPLQKPEYFQALKSEAQEQTYLAQKERVYLEKTQLQQVMTEQLERLQAQRQLAHDRAQAEQRQRAHYRAQLQKQQIFQGNSLKRKRTDYRESTAAVSASALAASVVACVVVALKRQRASPRVY